MLLSLFTHEENEAHRALQLVQVCSTRLGIEVYAKIFITHPVTLVANINFNLSSLSVTQILHCLGMSQINSFILLP